MLANDKRVVPAVLMNTKTAVLISLLLSLVAGPAFGSATSLDSSIIGMFPKDVSEFGYADLSQARQFSWFPQFQAQLVPVPLVGFEQFLEAAQMQQKPSIERVAWTRITSSVVNSNGSLDGKRQIVGVAVGHFDLDAIQSFLKSRNIPVIQGESGALYSSGTGSGSSDIFFALIDAGTIAFGPLEPLQRILKTRNGEEESLLVNEKMMNLIDQANGEGIFWGVLDSDSAGLAIQQLIPEAATFPDAHAQLEKIKDILITLEANGDCELHFQGITSSSKDAIGLWQLLQAGLFYRQYEASQSNPELAKILQGLSIAPNGNRLELSLSLTDEQVLSLIEHNSFALTM